MNPTPGRGAIELARRYDQISDPQFTHGRDLIDLLALKPSDQILDVGCGTGRLAAYALERLGAGGRIVGIDPEPARIDLAQKLRDPRLAFRLGRAEDLSSFTVPTFDIVYMNSALDHLTDKACAITEMHRVLKPGGRLGITTTVHDRPNEQRILMQKVSDALLSGGREAAPGVGMGEVRDLLQAGGLQTRVFELRTYVSSFEDVMQVIQFFDVNLRGQFLRGRKPEDIEQLRRALDRAVTSTIPEARRRDGIQLERYILLAVAGKPVENAAPLR
jgi:SAM-dependent methyltransferase